MAATKSTGSFSISRYEIINVTGADNSGLMWRIVQDLTGGPDAIVSGADAPFQVVFPIDGVFSGDFNFPTSELEANRKQSVVVLETRTPILPVNVPMGLDQTWRIRFEFDMRETVNGSPNNEFGWLKVNVGTRNQILNDGTVTSVQGAEGIKSSVVRDPGELAEVWFQNETATIVDTQTPYLKRVKKKGQGWFKRAGKTDPAIAPSYPMSYRMTVVPHGIALYVWDNASIDQNDDYSWFVIQRQVNNVSGITPTSGKYPVHCLYECSRRTLEATDFPVYYNNNVNTTTEDAITVVYDQYGQEFSVDSLDPLKTFWIMNPQDREDPEVDRLLTKGIYRFVVREYDVFKPWDVHKLATHHQIDSNAIINPLEQLSVTPDNRFVITFPTGLTTERFMYPNHEIDLIAFSSAEVVSQGANIPIDSYKPSVDVTDDRLYQGMYSTLPNGNGMRVLVQVYGGTIPDNQTDVSVV